MVGYGQSSKIKETISIEDYAFNVIEVIKSLKDSSELSGDITLLGFHTGSAIANEIAIIEPELINKVIFVTYPFFDAAKRAELLGSQTKGTIDQRIGSRVSSVSRFSRRRGYLIHSLQNLARFPVSLADLFFLRRLPCLCWRRWWMSHGFPVRLR